MAGMIINGILDVAPLNTSRCNTSDLNVHIDAAAAATAQPCFASLHLYAGYKNLTASYSTFHICKSGTVVEGQLLNSSRYRAP